MIAAFSGGKDSTAMVVRMAELGERFVLLFTPTGNELPELRRHLDRIASLTGASLVVPPGPTLDAMIREFGALPNHRQRWCTRTVKIQPCVAYLKAHPGSTLCVGLRADEESREGLYGAFAAYRYPLREWGWGLREVVSFCRNRGLKVPKRTDCALCYGQRLGEWYRLWRDYPGEFAKGEAYEAQTGHTFRSDKRDSWPAPLVQLRGKFEQGHKPRGGVEQLELYEQPCRVCRL